MAVAPKVSASLLLLKPTAAHSFEVLMIQRRSRMSYSNSYVFPGGLVEPDDSSTDWLKLVPGLKTEEVPAALMTPALDLNALRVAAIRETFEEVQLFLGSGQPGLAPDAPFSQQCVSASAVPSLAALHYFLRFVTPLDFKQRFDTTFFVAEVPPLSDVRLQLGESKAFKWLDPLQALNLFEKREMKMYPPQLYSLYVLSHVERLQDLQRMSQEMKKFPILPSHVHVGGTGLTGLFPGDELYPLSTSHKSSGTHRITLDLIEGLSFSISPGHNSFLDLSPYRLARKGNQWLRVPK